MTRGTLLGTQAKGKSLPMPDRTGKFIGVGRTHMSRGQMFRESSGVAVTMEQPVFYVPSFTGEGGGQGGWTTGEGGGWGAGQQVRYVWPAGKQ